MTALTSWLAVLGVGLGSLLLRLAPHLVPAWTRWPERVERALRHAGTATLVYLTVSGAAAGSGGSPPMAAAMAAGLLAGLVPAVRGSRPALAIGIGLAVGVPAVLAALALTG